MARSKPNPHIVESREQAEGTMAELAALARKLSELETEMNREIDLAKAKTSQHAVPLLARKKELENGLAIFAKLNKSTLFVNDAKSIDLTFGVMGFRASTKIVQQNGITAEVTLERLHKFDFSDAIRTKEEMDKDVMKGWTDERLQTVGLRRQKSDGFFIEVKEDALSA